MISSTKHVSYLQALGLVCRRTSVSLASVTHSGPRYHLKVPCRSFSAPTALRNKRIRDASKPESKHIEGVSNIHNPYAYTSGRWLNRDKIERNARYIDFDFDALCRHAIKLCHGAQIVKTYEKKEGGNNRVFLFTMDTGECIVARIPFSVAGPPRLTTNSEVATMEYIRSKATIPVPRVLSWSDDCSNSTGTEYIFLERSPGTQLHEIWDEMTSLEHIKCIRAVAATMKQTAKLSFPAYGSIYFKDAPLPANMKIDIGDGFCVGPNCGSTYWNSAAGESSLYGKRNYNRGPWSNISDYTSGLVASGFARIPDSRCVDPTDLSYRGSASDHTQLLQTIEPLLNTLLESKQLQPLTKPTLLHADINTRNVFVSSSDPTNLTAIIDWQSTSIEPAFTYARETPDFATPYNPRIGTEPAEHEQNESKEDKVRRRDQELCSDAFEICMKGFIPVIGTARSTDDTLLRLFRHCNTTWRHGCAGIRQDLLELSQQWADLGLPGTCPYSPSEKEIAEHEKQYEDFEVVLNLKAWLMQTLGTDSDGWIPTKQWEATKSAHRTLYDEWMKTARNAGEDGIPPDKADKLWPFDER